MGGSISDKVKFVEVRVHGCGITLSFRLIISRADNPS